MGRESPAVPIIPAPSRSFKTPMHLINPAARPRTARLAGATLAAAALLSAAAPSDASAETRVRARYALTLSGFDIGSATMQTGVGKANYDVNLSLRMSGLAKFLTGGKGAATSRGSYSEKRVIPVAYALNTRANDKGQLVRFAMAGGAVRQLSIEPAPKPRRDAVEVTEADKKNIVDPLSALVMPVSGSGELLSPGSCDRTIPVFDGRQRYDIQLRYDRMETAKPDTSDNADPKAAAGYEGKVVVCKARYHAISGHRPDRPNVKFMEDNKDMEVWLAPIDGTRTLIPWKISVRTEMGLAVITATSFVIDKDAKGANL
ncbi:DUF3108 domain-containing protein [Methylopila sp. M107]|uniref:DUF3108 domain-containing protein n=1 Tax=Methylopila sp. M107 TaxID=1101190 RepID=UPI00037A1BFA|nr:DUF3108 domain-containing protein [Methylopila sp. M107]